jgi:hypothetical protein
MRFGVRISTSTYNIDNITFTILGDSNLKPTILITQGPKMREIKEKEKERGGYCTRNKNYE